MFHPSACTCGMISPKGSMQQREQKQQEEVEYEHAGVEGRPSYPWRACCVPGPALGILACTMPLIHISPERRWDQPRCTDKDTPTC